MGTADIVLEIERLHKENERLRSQLVRAREIMSPFNRPLHHTMRESIESWTGCDLNRIRGFLSQSDD